MVKNEKQILKDSTNERQTFEDSTIVASLAVLGPEIKITPNVTLEGKVVFNLEGKINDAARKLYNNAPVGSLDFVKSIKGIRSSIRDFMKVIDNQASVWLNDQKMVQYLRPETLFGPKFESYLNNRHVMMPEVTDPVDKLKKEMGMIP